MATRSFRDNAGFRYTPPGGPLQPHRLAWPLRDVEPVRRRRRCVWESMDFSTRRTVSIGEGVKEDLVTIRFEDLPEDLLEMLAHAADGVQVEYRPDLSTSAGAVQYLLILDDPSVVALHMDRGRYPSHGEYEVRLRLRRVS